LHVDRHRVTQVLSNLLNNAAKYTPKGGRIEVEASVSGNDVAISVTDNGIGIDTEMLPLIFNMYAQAKQGTGMAQGGLGVGLNLVRRLVDLHGGRIVAHSDGVGKGSRFTVFLPLVMPGAASAAAGAGLADDVVADVAEGAGLRILVVDDNLDAAQMLGALLELCGHRVTLAHDGAQALADAARLSPQAVFLDIGLPDRNGFDVARALRGMAGMDGALLVALTGWGTEEDRRRSEESGFDAHLTKPAELDKIQALLEQATARRGA
jgi:CheY-like chemotaxis protein